MESLAYKELCIAFARDLQQVSEDVDALATKQPPGAALMPAVERARDKVAEYHRTLALIRADSERLAAQFAKHYSDEIADIAECLERLSA